MRSLFPTIESGGRESQEQGEKDNILFSSFTLTKMFCLKNAFAFARYKAVFTLGAWARWQSTILTGHWCEHTIFSSTNAKIRDLVLGNFRVLGYFGFPCLNATLFFLRCSGTSVNTALDLRYIPWACCRKYIWTAGSWLPPRQSAVKLEWLLDP